MQLCHTPQVVSFQPENPEAAEASLLSRFAGLCFALLCSFFRILILPIFFGGFFAALMIMFILQDKFFSCLGLGDAAQQILGGGKRSLGGAFPKGCHVFLKGGLQSVRGGGKATGHSELLLIVESIQHGLGAVGRRTHGAQPNLSVLPLIEACGV